MDDHNMIISLILRGCKMAKDLESRLESKTNLQPQVVAKSCDEIVRVFIDARERLNVSGHGQDFNPLQMYSSREEMNSRIFQEYFTKFLPALMMGDPGRSSSSSGMLMEGSSSVAGGSGELVMELGSGDMHAIGGAALDPAVTGPSSHRKPRRKEDRNRRTVLAPAPQTGNTEIPPDDGFTWRKYGQKEILGSKYPRGYYRCTHQKLYNCPAKKQVQRMDDNPSIYQVTYRGKHTCHKSATSPSVAPPPPPPEITSQHMTHSLTAATTTHFQPLGQWLEFSLGGRDSGAGPSTTMNRHVDQFPVADMADVMFNSGSSSSNSMEFIFSSSIDDRWESGDKKN